MRIIVIFLTCILMVGGLYAQKIVPFPGILKAGMLVVTENRIYITEQPRIHIYSLKNFKLIKTVGKEGEGPKEFKFNPFLPMLVYPYSDQLLVNSMNKISFLTQDGDFIREMKAPAFTIFCPLKNGFIGNPMVPNKNNQMVLAVTLYNSQLEKIKELHCSDVTVGPGASFHLPPSSHTYQVYDNKIFVVIGTEGFVIDVFDLNGNKLSRIKKECSPIPIDKDFKERSMYWFENYSPFKKGIGTQFKVTFKKNYPAIKNILVDSGKIYVFTYKEIKGKTETFVLDLKGKELEKIYFKLPNEEPLYTPLRYSIRNNIFYKLVENEENEEWELHIQDLKIK